MYFIGVSGLRVLPLLINGWMDLISFARYSELLVQNRKIFIPHLYLAPPQGVTPSEFHEYV